MRLHLLRLNWNGMELKPVLILTKCLSNQNVLKCYILIGYMLEGDKYPRYMINLLTISLPPLVSCDDGQLVTPIELFALINA